MSLHLKFKYSFFYNWMMIFVALLMATGCMYILHLIGSENVYSTSDEITRSIFKQSLYFMLILCVVAIPISIIRMFNEYAITASSKGLWLEPCGLLSWDMVSDIYCYKYSGESFLIIKLNDMSLVKQRVSLKVKIQLFFTSLTHPNCFALTHFELDTSIVAAQLHDFMLTQQKLLK